VVRVTGRVQAVQLDVVGSTQDEVRERLARAAPGEVVAVRARSQRSGRGREGRTWQDPPGGSLLLSVGVRGVPVDVLDELPRRIAAALLDAVSPAGAVAWKAPNDLVCAASGAKVAGVLVDARTSASVVDEVIVGVGCNVTGPAFDTPDGRRATSLQQLGARLDEALVVERLAALLSGPRRA
jgi:BirA family biotin operon repressor/biotin-[acetyl-CoA-carboxylase] ligase